MIAKGWPPDDMAWLPRGWQGSMGGEAGEEAWGGTHPGEAGGSGRETEYKLQLQAPSLFSGPIIRLQLQNTNKFIFE